MKTYIAILAALLSAGSLHATNVYRYEWTESPSYANSLGAYTGHIDFFDKSGTATLVIDSDFPTDISGFDAIADFEFTLHERLGEPPTLEHPNTSLPTIPPRTFTLANLTGALIVMYWGKESPVSEDVLVMGGSMIFHDPVQFATIGGYSLDGFWPQPYQWDQEPHVGQWLSTGKVKVDKHGVPDTGSTFCLLLLGVGAMVVVLKTKRFAV